MDVDTTVGLPGGDAVGRLRTVLITDHPTTNTAPSRELPGAACLFIGNCATEITGINQYRVLFDNKPQLAHTHDYGFGSPGAVGGTAGSGTGCVGKGGGIGCGASVSPGCGAASPAGGIPSVGNVGALQKPAGTI